MSAICGIVRTDRRPVSAREVERMLSTFDYRPSDRKGIWTGNGFGCAQSLLFNTPESKREQLPLVRPEPGLVFVGEIRIDNREDLIRTLGMNTDPSPTDAELVLSAFEKWEERCVDHLLGDFAFAIWNERDRSLFCARDHLGQKPFYFHEGNGCFIFGTEMKAIFASESAPERKIRNAWLAGQAFNFYYDRERTLFEKIETLPAAHTLRYSPRGIRKTRYWQLDPYRSLNFRSREECAEAFGEIYQEAVDCRLRSAWPITSMLSGGLDSSSITAMAFHSKRLDQPLSTISWLLPKDDDWYIPDERWILDFFLKDYPDLDNHEILASGRTFLEKSPLPSLLEGLNLEVRKPYVIDTYERVRDLGSRTLLWGDGGDQSISNSAEDYGIELFRNLRWFRLVRELWMDRKVRRRSLPDVLNRFLFEPLLGRRGVPFYAGVYDFKSNLETPLSRQFIEESGIRDVIRELKPELPPKLWFHPNRASIYGFTQFGPWPMLAEQKTRLSMIYGIESRSPILDVRVLEFALAAPLSAHRHEGISRRLIRDACPGLPERIRWRRGKLSTFPDMHRRIAAEADEMREVFKTWKNCGSHGSMFDFTRFEQMLSQIEDDVVNEAIIPSVQYGPFVFSFMIGEFLHENSNPST